MYNLQDALSLVPDLIPLTRSFHMETHDQVKSNQILTCPFFGCKINLLKFTEILAVARLSCFVSALDCGATRADQ